MPPIIVRTGGRIDRTMHAYLHIAIPLGLPLPEMVRCINDLTGLLREVSGHVLALFRSLPPSVWHKPTTSS